MTSRRRTRLTGKGRGEGPGAPSSEWKGDRLLDSWLELAGDQHPGMGPQKE